MPERLAKQEGRIKGLIAAFLVLLTLALVMTMTSSVYIALQSYHQAEDNGEELNQVSQVNKQLIDCTEPSGKCFKRGQTQTAQAVKYLNEQRVRDITAALSCVSDGITQQYALVRCTVKRSDKAAKRSATKN